MSRGFLLVFIALGGALAVLFAVFPLWDLEVAQVFFDPERARFPLSVTYEWNLVRPAANWVPFLLLAPAIRGAAQAHLPPPENADRPVGRALSHRLFSDRPGRRRQSRAEGELGQTAAERRAAICLDGGLPALVAAERRQQAELLLCVGRGERSLLDGGAGDACTAAAPSSSARRLAPCASCSDGISSAISSSPV